MNIYINEAQLTSELEKLASFSETPAPSVTRIVFSAVDMAARGYIKQLCAAAALEIREDAVGNTFARWRGRQPELPAVGTGSHIDAIPHAGKFDGTVGVLGGLEAIRALQRAGAQPKRSVELLLFTSEEPTRFGIGCLGSRLLCGSLDASAGEYLKDRNGLTLDEVRRQAGYTAALETVAMKKGCYAAFVELHIEQGPLLEKEDLAVGVVTAIAAPSALRVLIEGEGGHAGAVLLPDRHDAFLAAAELALAVELAAKGSGSLDTVGTVGVCEVFPGAVNSIPSKTKLEIDIRDVDLRRRDAVLAQVLRASEEIGARRQVRFSIETINADPPAQCDEHIVEALCRSCDDIGLPHKRLVSRAYHDSLFMSQIAPVSMLFVRCRGGISHRPDEYSSAADIAAGVKVLAQALYRLAEN